MAPVKERVIMIDIENVHDQVILTKRTQDVFLLFKGKDVISNSSLLSLAGMNSKGSLKRYTDKLETEGLIESSIVGKEKHWRITGKGRKVLRRFA